MGKQFINIIGAAVVLAVVVVGTLLIGVPMLSQSSATAAQADQVDQLNVVSAARVTALQQAKKNFGSLSADVRALRAQIPLTNKQDDVFDLVASAATATGVVVKSVTASDPIAWTMRTAATDDGAPPTGAPTSSADAGGNASASPAPSPTPSPSASAAPAGAGTAATSPQIQIPFIIIVQSSDAAATAAFIDALGKGPRLIGIVHSTLTKQNEGFELTVNALAFVRAEK